MLPQPTDIKIHAKTVWLSQDYIMRMCVGITDEYLRKARTTYKKTVKNSLTDRNILPDTGKSWRWAMINNSFFYAYDNIPDRKPAMYRSTLPGKNELVLITGNSLAEVETDFDNTFKEALKDGYKKYLHQYGDCTPVQQKNLSKYAALLQAAHDYITANGVNTSKYNFFNELAAFIKANNVPYAAKHPRILKGKLELLEKCGDVTKVVILPRSGNDNAKKEFVHDEIKAWVLQLLTSGANYTDAFIIKKIRQMCALTCIPAPSPRWIGTNITQTHNIKYLTAAKRFSEGNRYGQRYKGHQRFENAVFTCFVKVFFKVIKVMSCY